jgi:nucleotide-binding universal stress UspA family protein
LYDKILVPIDGSDHSVRAMQEAMRIAKLVEGKITLMHVFSIGTSFIKTSTQNYYYDLVRKKGRRILTDGMKKAETEGCKVETLLVEGDAVEKIVKTARECDFDLIVMGARGLSKIKGLLLGSVSEGVIRNAPCPVLVTR